MTFSGITAAAFDLDSTLIDSAPDLLGGIAATLKEFNITAPAAAGWDSTPVTEWPDLFNAYPSRPLPQPTSTTVPALPARAN